MKNNLIGRHLKKLLLAVFWVINVLSAKSQDIDLTGSVANSSIPGNNGTTDQNVDLSTGTISPSIKLMNIKGRDLSSTVSIIYTNGRGRKVNDPTDILDALGKGWKLIAGGYIKRTVRGIRDDKYYNLTPYTSDLANARGWLDMITGIPNVSVGAPFWNESCLWYSNNYRVSQLVLNDFQHANTNPPSGITQDYWDNGRDYYYRMATLGVIDNEPDLFEFNLNGITGSFIFDENGEPMLLEASNIDIQVPSLNYYDGGNWIITTDDGTKYIFENNDNFREITKEIAETGDDDNIIGTPDIDESHKTTEQISTWYLSRIESVTGDEITLEYDNAPDKTTEFLSLSDQRYTYDELPDNCLNNVYVFNSGGWLKTESIIKFKKNLHNINTSQGKIEFSYALNGSMLSEIKKTGNNNQLQVHFTIPYPFKKLVQKPVDGSTHELVYSFEYYDDSDFPESNSKYQDYWGYFNNTLNNGNNGFEVLAPYSGILIPGSNTFTISGGIRSPQYTTTLKGALKKVTYPKGGSVEYAYEINDYWDGSANKTSGGLRIKSVTVNDGENGNINMVTNYSYTKLNSVESSGEISYSLDKLYDINALLWLRQAPNTQCGVGTVAKVKYFISRNSFPDFMHSQDYLCYSHVEISNPGKGKTGYDFTCFSTNPDTDPEVKEFNYQDALLGTVYMVDRDGVEGIRNDNSCERGLITKKTIYDENTFPIIETNYEYEFHPITEKIVKGLKIFTHNYFSNSSSSGTHAKNYFSEYYSIKSRWVYLKKVAEIEKSPTQANISLNHESNYYYENTIHKKLTKQKSLNTDGSHTITYFKYNSDMNVTGSFGNDDATVALGIMHVKKMVAPIQVLQTNDLGGIEKIIGSTINYYKSVNGLPLLYKKYSAETNGNLTFSNNYFASVDNTQHFVFDPLIFKAYSSNRLYSPFGQLLEVQSFDNRINTILYDNNFNKVKATISNASAHDEECSFTNFEEGALTFNAFSTVITSDAHTGIACNKIEANPNVDPSEVSFSYSQYLTPVNNNRKYKVSAWVKTQNGFGSNAGQAGELVINANDINGQIYTASSYKATAFSDTYDKWIYLESIIDLPLVKSEMTNNPQTIGFKAHVVNYDNSHYVYVDDIRIEPADATTMQTITYDEQFGNVSSQSTSRSLPTYLEYDGYARATVSKDENKNVLKQVIYNDAYTICETPIITSNIDTPLFGQNVYFDSYGYSNNEQITSYLWDFGDPSSGSANTSTIHNPVHPFALPGNYTVTLSISYSGGLTKSQTKLIKVRMNQLTANAAGPPDIHYWHAPPPNPGDPTTAIETFHLLKTGGCGPFTYSMELKKLPGGGNYPITVATSATDELTYEFNSPNGEGPGNYKIIVIVSDNYGHTEQDEMDITVTLHMY